MSGGKNDFANIMNDFQVTPAALDAGVISIVASMRGQSASFKQGLILTGVNILARYLTTFGFYKTYLKVFDEKKAISGANSLTENVANKVLMTVLTKQALGYAGAIGKSSLNNDFMNIGIGMFASQYAQTQFKEIGGLDLSE